MELIIHNDDEFHEAQEKMREVWAIIDRNLIDVNNNLAEVRKRPWKVLYNFKLLRTNRHTLRFINELLMSNLDLIAAREKYVAQQIKGDYNGGAETG